MQIYFHEIILNHFYIKSLKIEQKQKNKINEIKNALSKNKSPHCALCALRLYVKIVFLYTQWGGILLEIVYLNLNSNADKFLRS